MAPAAQRGGGDAGGLQSLARLAYQGGGSGGHADGMGLEASRKPRANPFGSRSSWAWSDSARLPLSVVSSTGRGSLGCPARSARIGRAVQHGHRLAGAGAAGDLGRPGVAHAVGDLVLARVQERAPRGERVGQDQAQLLLVPDLEERPGVGLPGELGNRRIDRASRVPVQLRVFGEKFLPDRQARHWLHPPWPAVQAGCPKGMLDDPAHERRRTGTLRAGTAWCPFTGVLVFRSGRPFGGRRAAGQGSRARLCSW